MTDRSRGRCCRRAGSCCCCNRCNRPHDVRRRLLLAAVAALIAAALVAAAATTATTVVAAAAASISSSTSFVFVPVAPSPSPPLVRSGGRGRRRRSYFRTATNKFEKLVVDSAEDCGDGDGDGDGVVVASTSSSSSRTAAKSSQSQSKSSSKRCCVLVLPDDDADDGNGNGGNPREKKKELRGVHGRRRQSSFGGVGGATTTTTTTTTTTFVALLHEAARNLSKELNVPMFLSRKELLEERRESYNDAGGDDDNLGNEGQRRQNRLSFSSSLTHALTVGPYSSRNSCGGSRTKNQAEGVEERERQREQTKEYAVGLLALLPAAPLPASSSTSSSQQQQKRRRRKRNASLSSTKTTKPYVVDFVEDFCVVGIGDTTSSSASRSRSDLLVKAVKPRNGRQRNIVLVDDIDNAAVATTATTTTSAAATIVDFTAGYGRDAAVLAQAGARKVELVERDPVVYQLLRDGLRRLRNFSSNNGSEKSASAASPAAVAAARDLVQKLSLRETACDGRDVAERLSKLPLPEQRPDVAYLDPMFPSTSSPRGTSKKRKSAAVKKNMQLLRGLLLRSEEEGEGHGGGGNNKVSNDGEYYDESADDEGGVSVQGDATDIVVDDNTENYCAKYTRQREERELFEAACEAATMRVVVKRPINAPYINDGGAIGGNGGDRVGNAGGDVSNVSGIAVAKPTYQIRGSINRWDVYDVSNKNNKSNSSRDGNNNNKQQ